MQVKTTKKISRSAVATVLATSSVALGLPAQTNATILFNDVKPADFFYTAVNELSEKKIVNGYGDGTFRPFNSVTRGEAAKMLALSLKLDVTNAETTQFSDVKKGDIFYKYIAALANKGIINGYPDGSFKPNEVVQRGAMAKMVALGYEFILATNITHPFKDVDQNNIFNQHIQTLVNLNITKGTSFNTFEPAKAVTRGELATFISRANKANAGKPLYVVDNIIGNKIYINSVGYTISSNVASYIKAENKSALIGAHVEGTFNGMTLTNVTKLTLNATGNANSIYTFDGGNSTFNGTLVVNGSYLKFKNWTLNGQTIVSETPRKSLAQYNRISELKIASLASGVIDFTRPTNPDDGILNNGDNGSLKPGTGTSPYAPYSEKLSPIHKYVDFTNVTVRNLFVEQNRAYVAAQKEIAMVTVRRDVEFAELNFNMRNLYLEGDASLTLYGTHDIATVYKNSYYSVYFNTNSDINTLIVDNSNGWIDLGDYVVVDKVIIPPKTTPNDIFDDYKNDNDKIGTIEDNTGEEVDRNPIENGIVPDVTPSRIEIKKPILTLSNAADVTVEVSETGKLYYLVLPVDEKPSARYIVQSENKVDVLDSDLVSEGKYVHTFRTKDILEEEKKYYIYIVHVDDAGNFSRIADDDFTTKDGTPPQFLDGTDAKPLPGGKRIQLDYRPSEPGKLYYIVRKYGSINDPITAQDIIDGHVGSPITVDAEDVQLGDFIKIYEDELGNELVPETPYMVYAALVDESLNSIRDIQVFKKNVTTKELDEESPYVTGPDDTTLQRLIPISGTLNQFYMYFNERLDKSSAEKVENYSLSGTGIVNIPGQLPIQPTSVKYEDYQEDRGRVLITIPSLTGFINKDTLRVTVSSNVEDLAENKFESLFNEQTGLGPRNFAQYTHDDTAELRFEIQKVDRLPAQKKAIISYNTTKAGQIYYMLLPNSFDITRVRSDEFVAEFGPNPTTKFNLSNNKKAYLEGSPTNLSAPYTTEKDNQSFTYDYSTLNPERAESYTLYMVLRDRSGNFSEIKSAVMIGDEEPPVISSFDVKPVPNSDTSINVTLTSVNEPGSVRIGYFEKYVLDTDSNSLNFNKYILNPAIYNSNGQLKQFGTSSNMTNEEKMAEFEANVQNIISPPPPLNVGVNTYRINNLKKNTEYVVYAGVVDEFGNFTAFNEINNTKSIMAKEVYTDGIAPEVVKNIVYREIDDQLIVPNGNGTFTLTFTEMIGREYKDPTEQVKNNLDQVSYLEGATSTFDLGKILEIKDSNGQDIVGKFKFESYSVGSTINSLSVLKIKAEDRSVWDNNFTVNVLELDQKINIDNKANKVVDLAKYINPGLNIKNFIRYAILQPDNNNFGNTASTKMNVRLDFGISMDKDTENMEQMFYYAVVNNTSTSQLDKAAVEELITKADRGATENLTTNIIAYGRYKFNKPADLSNVLTLSANPSLISSQPATGTTNVFSTSHNLFIFSKDKYGNIIWAKANDLSDYITIKPIGTNPDTP